MSYRILIADDEELDRRGMRLLLSRCIDGTAVIDEACNGTELLNMASGSEYDLIIADIEMPGMNGLQAVAQLREHNKNIQVIIMTAYGSYEYVKEALRLHSFDYLEKPARREKVAAVVQNVLSRIDAERRHRQEFEQLKSFIEEMLPVLCSEVMAMIENNEADRTQIGRYLDAIGFGNYGHIMSFQIIPRGAGTGEYSLQHDMAELRQFEEIRHIVQPMGMLYGHIINHTMACLVPDEAEHTDYQSVIYALNRANAVKDALSPMNRGDVKIGIGSRMNITDDLNISYRESLRALYIKQSEESICHYSDVLNHPIGSNSLQENMPAVLNAIYSCDIRKLQNILRNIFLRMDYTGEVGNLSEMKDIAIEFLIVLRRNLSSEFTALQLNDCIPQIIWEQIMQTDSNEAIHSVCDRVCTHAVDVMRERNNGRSNDITEQARAMVDQHYSEDISLDNIAESIGVSQYYLSRLFKQRLGVNFSTYLTDLRIRKACQLIERSNQTIREIAEKVGYNDPEYFARVFKKIMGCTITEYRKN